MIPRFLSFIAIALVPANLLFSAPQENSLSHILGKGATVSISPDSVISETFHTYSIDIVLGHDGLSVSDSIGIVCGSNIDRWHSVFPSHFWGTYPQPWQADDPSAANYVTLKCSRPDIKITAKVGISGPMKPYENQPDHFIHSLNDRMRYVLEIKADKDLAESDRITVIWGDTSHGSPGTKSPPFANTYYFLPFRYSLIASLHDSNLPIRRGEFDLLPSIRIKAKNAVKFHLAVQPVIKTNESFTLKIAAIDEYCNPDENFAGTVSLNVPGAKSNLPHSVPFTKQDKGCRTIENVSIENQGWYKINADCDSIKGTSNYIIVSDTPGPYKIYFGDMHGHTYDCDGRLPTFLHYTYARDVSGLDFASVSCHAEYFGTEKAWRLYLNEAAKYYSPNSFITFFSYEWAGQSHYNVYFIDENDVKLIYGAHLLGKIQPDNPPFRTDAKGIPEFMAEIRKINAPVMVLGHFHSDYNNIDDGILWLYEIHSTHYHEGREKLLQNLLSQGKYYGVNAGGDAHRFPIGHLYENPGKTWPLPGSITSCQLTNGLHAVLAANLTRKSIYYAMKLRHSYGTDGQRIVMLLDSNGKMMGERITLGKNDKPVFNVRIGGTAEISEIAMWKYDGKRWSQIILASNLADDKWTGSWKDPDYSSFAIYYLRITQADSHHAWSSPLWFSTAYIP